MVIGIGRGDSARRTIGLKPVKVDEFERSTAMIKELDERPPGALERLRRPHRVGAGPARDPRLHRGLRTAGARRCGPHRRRRHHPARRPGDHRVDRRAGARGGGGGRARSVRDQGHRVRAGARVRRHGRRVRAGALVPGHGLEPRLRPAREARQGDAACGAHRLRRAHAAGAVRLLRAQPRRRRARPAGVGRDVRALLCPRHGRAARREAAAPRGRRRRPVEHLPHDLGPGGRSRSTAGDHPGRDNARTDSLKAESAPSNARRTLHVRQTLTCQVDDEGVLRVSRGRAAASRWQDEVRCERPTRAPTPARRHSPSP